MVEHVLKMVHLGRIWCAGIWSAPCVRVGGSTRFLVASWALKGASTTFRVSVATESGGERRWYVLAAFISLLHFPPMSVDFWLNYC
uniref:Uncharacterized protein n=1 Tax=Arundo donax TaxID=35708 RepID=A0A0A9AZI9_ARUDO